MHVKQITTKTVSKSLRCVYSITNLLTSRVYIGYTRQLYKRWVQHRTALKRGEHDNKALQESWDKYGKDAFDFNIVEECEHEVSLERERFHILQCESVFNVRSAEGHKDKMKGHVITPEQRKKQSDALKGKRPKNLDALHASERKPLAYYINDVLIATFESATQGAAHFGMKPNILHQYIGITRKTKKFPVGYKLEYI